MARPRLDDLASRSTHAAVTLASAPAGFGKTTLVADWFADEATTAWLSLDPSDDDLGRFWTYVISALATVVPDLGPETISLLQGPGGSAEALVATLINDLETIAAEVVLVLDDYHVIESIEIHDSVRFLIDHQPSQLRIVIATRADPPFPLAALRAAGELLEVRAADLRFTAEEAASYLNGAMDLTLATGDIEALDARTEGWIAALQLAALSMQGRADPSEFIAEFTGDDRFILDYLADEVLGRQTAEVRDFLLATSILTRLTGPLCAAVTGDDAAKATLEGLERSNLFLVPLDDRRTWYRYHHLFGDVLRARLLDEQPDRLPELHRRASTWYAANGDPQEAVGHALAGNDPAWAAELIERVAPEMHRVRQEAIVRGWLEALPEELFVDRPVLTIFLVGSRMSTGDPSGVEALLELVESTLARTAPPPIVFDQEQFAHLPAQVLVYRAALALLAGDPAGTIEHASRALELIDPGDHLRRGSAVGLQALARWTTGDLDGAKDLYTEAVRALIDAGHLGDALGCSLALADIQIAQGRLSDAARTFDTGLRWTTEQPGLRGAADMHVGQSEVLIERNDLDAADRHLEISRELGEAAGLPQHAYRWRVTTARMLRARGDLDGALELIRAAAPLYDTDFSPPVRPVAALEARVQLARGDLDAADRWVDATGLGPADELTYVHEFEHVTLARVLLAHHAEVGDVSGAERARLLLTRLLAAADEGDRAGSSIEILVLLATAHRALGDAPAALVALEDALRRAEPEGHIRVFLHAGPAVTDLLRTLGSRAAATPHTRRVLAAADRTGHRQQPSPTVLASRLDELSDRELDVLRLLRSDLSGPDIAGELHVSLNTLRTHTKHIYTKLGATNRREAVTRAAERGL